MSSVIGIMGQAPRRLGASPHYAIGSQQEEDPSSAHQLAARIGRRVFDMAETPEAGAAEGRSGLGRFGEDANQFAQVKVATGQYSHNPLAC